MRSKPYPSHYPTAFDNQASRRANLLLWMAPLAPFCCLIAAALVPPWVWGWYLSRSTIGSMTVVAFLTAFIVWIVQYAAMVDSHARNGGAIIVKPGSNAKALSPEEIRRSGE